MTLEIRPYRDDEAEAFYRVPAIVFGNYRGDQPAGDARPPGMAIPPEWSLCAFEDGELTTTYAVYPLVQRINGGKAPIAGVTMVGTLPWFRRRGYLRKIIETDLRRRYDERMQPIAALLASMARIYQRYGYAVCTTSMRYTIDPRWIGIAPSLPSATGSWRQGSPDELPLLERLYREFSSGRNGYLHRAPVIWEMQVLGRNVPPELSQFGFGPSLIAIYEEHGEPQGYLAYTTKHFDSAPDGAGPGQRLLVRDYVWKTPAAYHAIWEFLRDFDLVVRLHVLSAPVDDPAQHVLLDPRELNATARDAILARIIDVERALPLRPYGREGRVTFELRDVLCPWNEGRWSLDAGQEGATLKRTTETPQLVLDVSALAQLLYGQVSPSQAVRYGRAESSPGAPLALWDALFGTEYAPFCPDTF